MSITISSSSLKKNKPLKTINPSIDPILTSGQGIINNAISGINTTQQNFNTAQKNQVDLANKLNVDRTKLSEKPQYAESQRNLAGVNVAQSNLDKYSQQLNDIQANISGLENNAKAIPMKIQEQFANTGATDAGVAPIQAGELRKNAIKALTQASLADVITANINNSQIRYNSAVEKARQAVDLKYQPVEQEIKNLQNQLSLNDRLVVKPAERKLMERQKLILNERSKMIAQKKQNENAINDIRLQVAKIDPSKLYLLDNANTPEQAISMAQDALKKQPTPKLSTQKNLIADILNTGKNSAGQTIGNGRGADGYVDPYVYIKAFQNWTGATSDFLRYFPISTNINPLSYKLLPEAIQPKKKETKTSERQLNP